MRGVEGVRDLDREIDHPIDRQRFAADLVRQGVAFEELQYQERPPLVVSDFVDGADVGMVQGRRRARFAEESVDRLAIVGVRTGQELEGHPSPEREVLAQVDLAHSSTPQLLEHAVV